MIEHVHYLCNRLRRDRHMKRVPALLLAAMLVLGASPVNAQEWPTRPVKVIFPYSPGGGGDAIARLAADRLGRRLGQIFIVENQAGAGGIIGSTAAAKAAPDGYTLVVSSVGSIVVAPQFNPAPFDAINSFTHIALFGGPPAVLVVNPAVEAKTLKEFIALTKARPQGLGYGSPGHGSHTHLIGEMFRQKSGANIFHVPYKGGGASIADLIGNHVPAAFGSLGSVSTYIRAGKVRLLAISTERRNPEFPDVPTFAEIGYGDLVSTTWFGLSGPAGLPRDIVNRLNAEVRAVLVLPDVRERLQMEGVETNDLDPDAYTAFIRAEMERWVPLARALK